MMRQPNSALEQYASQHSLRLHPCQKKLVDLTVREPAGFMMTPPEELQLLQNLCRAINARRTLDIGVFTGCSSLSIALALPENGQVYALDVTDKYLRKVGTFDIWKEAGVANKIVLRLGDAVESMESILKSEGPSSFDYCYIDADKEQYIQYYELAMHLVRSGGIIAVDNTLWMGQVINPNANDPDTQAIRAFNKHIASDQRVDVSFLNMGDGVTICFKK